MNRNARGNACRPNTFPWTAADGGLSRLLTDFVGQTASSARRSPVANAIPAPLTAWETEAHYTVEFELPGFTRDELTIELLDDTLTVSGRREASLPEGATLLRNERARGELSRTVEFSSEVEAEGVHASFENGLLRVTLPKRAETRPKKIEIGIANPNPEVEISTATPDAPETATDVD